MSLYLVLRLYSSKRNVESGYRWSLALVDDPTDLQVCCTNRLIMVSCYAVPSTKSLTFHKTGHQLHLETSVAWIGCMRLLHKPDFYYIAIWTYLWAQIWLSGFFVLVSPIFLIRPALDPSLAFWELMMPGPLPLWWALVCQLPTALSHDQPLSIENTSLVWRTKTLSIVTRKASGFISCRRKVFTDANLYHCSKIEA